MWTHTEPANDQAAVTLLREAATAALALGDAAALPRSGLPVPWTSRPLTVTGPR